jgi:hypothetical protein
LEFVVLLASNVCTDLLWAPSAHGSLRAMQMRCRVESGRVFLIGVHASYPIENHFHGVWRALSYRKRVQE